jgi:NAD(P)H dehydrogenase (quinone)
MPPSIAVIYFSATGNTAQLADAIVRGASESLRVCQYRISGADIVDGRFRNAEALEVVDQASGVILGSPTFMGGPAAEFKAFADATSDRWSTQRWKDKVAAGFTSGTCANGDQSYTLTYLSVLASQHGMLWCNLDTPGGEDPSGLNRLGTQVGLASQATAGQIPECDLLTATHLGRRVARLVHRLAG